MERVIARAPEQKEVHRTVREVLTFLLPVVEACLNLITEGVIDCLVEPECITKFRALGEEQNKAICSK